MHPADQFEGLSLESDEKIQRANEIKNYSGLGLRADKTVKDILVLTDKRILCAQRASGLRGAGRFLTAGLGGAVGGYLVAAVAEGIAKKLYKPKAIKIKRISWEAKYSEIESLGERRQGIGSVFSLEVPRRDPFKFLLTSEGFGLKSFLDLLTDQGVQVKPSEPTSRLAKAMTATGYPQQVDECTTLANVTFADSNIEYCYTVNFRADSPEAKSLAENQRPALVQGIRKNNDSIFHLLSGYTLTHTYKDPEGNTLLSLTFTADDLG